MFFKKENRIQKQWTSTRDTTNPTPTDCNNLNVSLPFKKKNQLQEKKTGLKFKWEFFRKDEPTLFPLWTWRR